MTRFAAKRHPDSEEYAGYVEHPRFGKAPRFTGFDPDPDSATVHLHWNTQYDTATQLRQMERLPGWSPALPDDGTGMVRGTAIAADLSKQSPATVSVTHYYDIEKVCRQCGHRFIFFAEEQKYWYEELGFPLEADAVRCAPCRRRLQQIARQRERYEQLFRLPNRTTDETLEMADCCLTLIEEGVFHRRQTQRVRMLLNRLPDDRRSDKRSLDLTVRLAAIEAETGRQNDSAPPTG